LSPLAKKKHSPKKSFYNWQNKMIHLARAKLVMDLDDCRELARHISGKASLSALTYEQRWKLIEMLNEKGADVHNPPLSKAPVSRQGKHPQPSAGEGPAPVKNNGVCPGGEQEETEGVYISRLAYWEKRFPKDRPKYATNKQLAWIEALWKLYFADNRTTTAKGLRGFIYRQTKNLEFGPVSDLAFLRDSHVEAVLTPLKLKARQRNAKKPRA